MKVYVEYDPNKETAEQALLRVHNVDNRSRIYESPLKWEARPCNPIVLPDNTLRDHINDVVMEVLAREKAKQETLWSEAARSMPTPMMIEEEPTLWDRFAIAALTGQLAGAPSISTRLAAEASGAHADAMMELRRKRGQA